LKLLPSENWGVSERVTKEVSSYLSQQFKLLLVDQGIVCNMRGAGKKWDKATIEAVFLSMKTGRVREKNSRARDYAS
jgi:transposase InsO family protein